MLFGGGWGLPVPLTPSARRASGGKACVAHHNRTSAGRRSRSGRCPPHPGPDLLGGAPERPGPGFVDAAVVLRRREGYPAVRDEVAVMRPGRRPKADTPGTPARGGDVLLLESAAEVAPGSVRRRSESPPWYRRGGLCVRPRRRWCCCWWWPWHVASQTGLSARIPAGPSVSFAATLSVLRFCSPATRCGCPAARAVRVPARGVVRDRGRLDRIRQSAQVQPRPMRNVILPSAAAVPGLHVAGPGRFAALRTGIARRWHCGHRGRWNAAMRLRLRDGDHSSLKGM